MGRRTVKITSKVEFIIGKMGIRIKKARLRRNILAEELAEHVGISKGTLSAIEQGVPTVSIGAYAEVLRALDMESDLNGIAVDIEGKKKYEDVQLRQRKRATKRE